MRTKDMKSLSDAYRQVILGESVEIDEARQMKDPKKDSMVSKGGKTIVIDKSKEKEYLKKGWQLAEKKLDPVDDKANDKKFTNRKDKDIDNDGDVDSSDEYLHKRRAATDDAIDGGKKPAKNAKAKEEGNAFTKALNAAKQNGDKTFVVSGKKYSVTTKEEVEDEVEDKPKKKNPFAKKKDDDEGEEKDSEDKGEEESDDEDEDKKDVPKVVGKKDDKKKVASNAKTAEISKIGEGYTTNEDIKGLADAITDLHMMWESAAKKSVKGATDKGEEIDSTQSAKEKEFTAAHKGKSDKKVEDGIEDAKAKSKSAEDATKASSGKRPQDNAVGDKNVVKSTQIKEGAVVVDTSTQEGSVSLVDMARAQLAGKNPFPEKKEKNPHDARTTEAKAFLQRMAKNRGVS
jgi:hypothetical protein|tara:strand:+ start:410 stop:1615 length:1206 start_codon:yes stop_codon:yes gene_type:complete